MNATSKHKEVEKLSRRVFFQKTRVHTVSISCLKYSPPLVSVDYLVRFLDLPLVSSVSDFEIIQKLFEKTFDTILCVNLFNVWFPILMNSLVLYFIQVIEDTTFYSFRLTEHNTTVAATYLLQFRIQYKNIHDATIV